MRKDYHRIPIIEQEGRNLEEKKAYRDLDKKLMGKTGNQET